MSKPVAEGGQRPAPELLPCPFCGSARPFLNDYNSVLCPDCGGGLVYQDIDADPDEVANHLAITAWNRRARPAPARNAPNDPYYNPELQGGRGRGRKWERLLCARCGKKCPMLVPKGNPNVEVCSQCHYEVAMENATEPLP